MLPYACVQKQIAETYRLMRLTTYQRLLEAADHRTQRLHALPPLNRTQLEDSLDPLDEYTTLTASLPGLIDQPMLILKRPTETRAVLHMNGAQVLEADFADLPVSSPRVNRYCIFCRGRFDLSAFVRHHSYLHNYSYACRSCLEQRRCRLRSA